MPTIRKPRPVKKIAPERIVTRNTTIVLLLAGLMLAAGNLALMTSKTGTLSGLSESWTDLQENYAMPREMPSFEEPEPVKDPAPIVLASVVSYRDGEESMLSEMLVAPVLSYYDMVDGPKLKALLIERKNAGSKDVNLRLFFADGKEVAYLWPSTHSKDGHWVPPCAARMEDVTEDLPRCPERFQEEEPRRPLSEDEDAVDMMR